MSKELIKQSEEIVPVNMDTFAEEGGISAELTNRVSAYCSFTPQTWEDKAKLFKAMNNPDKRLRDEINKTIYVKDVYAEEVQVTNKETGEVTTAPRVVLIDKDGTSYVSVSLGVFGGLKKLFQIYGLPVQWGEPLPITIKQVSKGEKQLLTFDISI